MVFSEIVCAFYSTSVIPLTYYRKRQCKRVAGTNLTKYDDIKEMLFAKRRAFIRMIRIRHIFDFMIRIRHIFVAEITLSKQITDTFISILHPFGSSTFRKRIAHMPETNGFR